MPPSTGDDAALGLRERKEQRTRATIVDVASRLCVERGYEHTNTRFARLWQPWDPAEQPPSGGRGR